MDSRVSGAPWWNWKAAASCTRRELGQCRFESCRGYWTETAG